MKLLTADVQRDNKEVQILAPAYGTAKIFESEGNRYSSKSLQAKERSLVRYLYKTGTGKILRWRQVESETELSNVYILGVTDTCLTSRETTASLADIIPIGYSLHESLTVGWSGGGVDLWV